jgi:outer membrane protein OmpA-like peptidoglycan-associated protein
VAKEEVETRPVEMSELEAGIKLTGGHRVVLLVGGVPGRGTGDGESGASSGTTEATGSGESAESGGSAESGESSESSESSGGETPGGESGESSESGGGTASGGSGTATGGSATGGSATGSGTGTDTPPGPTPSKKVIFDAAHFNTDKCFPLPAALPTFRTITDLASGDASQALLVTGHTDTAGTASHNLKLSADRAASVAAYLKDDVDAWLAYFDSPPGSKKWGTLEEQQMLSALPWDGDTKYLARAPGTVVNADVSAAFRAFQRASKIPETGKTDKSTRKKLIAAYMAAEGTSPKNHLDTVGCGQRHLARDVQGDCAENRRVEIFVFQAAEYTPSLAEYNGASDEDKQGVFDQWNSVTEQQS